MAIEEMSYRLIQLHHV